MVAEILWLWQSDLARLLAQTGWVARIVLLILLGFSVFSWAIIYRKYTTLKLAREHTRRFLEAFRAADKLPEPRTLATAFPASPLVPVYAAGLKAIENERGNPHAKALTNSSRVSAALQLASTEQIQGLEQRMSFLATTGVVTPFIGLFGTVWGIMGAFMGLGESGATTLRAVAPGIAEALVATAAGLFAAIPAVIAYNQFLQQIREFSIRLDNFALEFLARAEKLS
jgi:biopolymer transport protein TolQ